MIGHSDFIPTDYKRQTMKAYDELATEIVKEYDAYFEACARLEADRFLAHLVQDDLVLDLGCGAGVASSYFVEHGYTSVSADLSEEMVKECSRRGLDNVVRLDLEELPFPYGSFDAIWAHTSLIHVPKERLAGVLEELGKTLKPGGILFVALREGGGEEYEGEPGVERWFSYFEGDEFEKYIPKGLDVVGRSRTGRRAAGFLNYHLSKPVG